MIHGRMSEAQKGFAILEDVDEGTFARFTRWAYNGYYSAATYSVARESHMASSMSYLSEDGESKAEQREDVVEVLAEPSSARPLWTFPTETDDEPATEPAQEPVAPAFIEGWDLAAGCSRKGKKKGKSSAFQSCAVDEDTRTTSSWQQRSPKTTLKESFIELKFAVLETHLPAPPPRSNGDSSEDYTEVFLSHARLYVFAEKYDIQPLKALAIQQLHQTLAIYTLYPERVGDIVELLRYVSANTAEAAEDGNEELRAMLVHYIGFEMDTLVKAPEFKELLLEDEGALLGDFLKMVGKRIRT